MVRNHLCTVLVLLNLKEASKTLERKQCRRWNFVYISRVDQAQDNYVRKGTSEILEFPDEWLDNIIHL